MGPLNQPGSRALLLLFVITALYLTYGYFNFYRDPLSIFFSEKHGYDRFYSATRHAEADAFLDGLETQPDAVRSHLGKAGSDPEICAVFLTTGREMLGRQYVETAVGSFLANMSRAERAAIHLKLFFVGVPAPETEHKSYNSLVAADVADDIVTYASSLPTAKTSDKMAKLESWSNDGNKQAVERKSVHDYAYALDQCVQTTKAPYIALFEDDILLANNWAASTLKHLHGIEQMMKDPRRRDPRRGRIAPGEPNSWLYLRLFNQERSTGWGGGTGFRRNKVHIISIAIGIPLAALLIISRRTLLPRSLARHIDSWTIIVICGIAVPLFVWLFFASGKASLVGTSAGIYEEWFGCCNQALVYNREHAQALSDFLMDATSKSGRAGRADMLPKDFAFQHGLARISAYPMPVQHIGRISATATTSDEARKIWSMAFENLKSESLAREHIRDVRELFGDDAAGAMRG
ncbi:hypothetical protein GGR57DRAFT_500972 [Xylariaceae sp. FL1272]|nr:hypothetical protein GGR57DRAFT_500972 [Xylariaceae sp. FL1272]